MLCGHVSLLIRNRSLKGRADQNSQAEIYAAICVACMPSLAKFWKNSLEGTKLLTSIRSLLQSASSATRSVYSKNSKSSKSKNQRSSFESASALRTEASEYDPAEHPFPSLAANNGREQPKTNEVYKMVTINVSSQEASSEKNATSKAPV